MPDVVNLTIDGKPVRARAGTLLIDAAKQAGIEIPSFCYYEGLSLQAACRMCLVEVEKAPKLLTACTLPVSEGMVVKTATPQVDQARKSMVEFLLTNHPLDCPVCDKGGECELQDMTYRYGLAESRFVEIKVHVDEKQWSPVVFYDAPRCILCYRCVRICDEGLGVKALGVINRGAHSEIAPNHGEHLECDECGMCIDICPVGALTSGIYRYKTRPWEMQHVGTVCTHCGDGCKTTLGVRSGRIIRGNNRDHSGINGEFLCIKGRYAFDFNGHPERLRSPLMRIDGKLQPVSWSQALEAVAAKFKEVMARNGKFGVIGSNHTTNEENYYLLKFARQILRTGNVDHHRTGDVGALLAATENLATVGDLYTMKASLVIAADLAQQHPLLAFQLRANHRHHASHTYVVTPAPVREDQYAVRSVRAREGGELAALESLRDQLKTEPELAILFGDAIKGDAVSKLVAFGDSLGIPVKYVCLVDYSNSRGAFDMGLVPSEQGLALLEILASEDLDVLWVVGANPLKRDTLRASHAFVVVHEMFLTETAQRADVIFPVASAYEKPGTVTNTCGQVQRLRAAATTAGVKTDLEIIGLLSKEMGTYIGMWHPDKVAEEIRQTVHGYNVASPARPDLIRSARDTLFTSGTLGRYSKTLHSVLEAPGRLYAGLE